MLFYCTVLAAPSRVRVIGSRDQTVHLMVAQIATSQHAECEIYVLARMSVWSGSTFSAHYCLCTLRTRTG
jgi:hypothetical protein